MSERKPAASQRWVNESNIIGDEDVTFQPRHADRDTGIEVIRLSTQPFINTHIYPEAPISTPDGRRFIWRRSNPFVGETNYWIADLDTLRVRQVTDEPNAGAPIISLRGDWFYYTVGRDIWRMDPTTFDREYWMTVPEDLGRTGSVSTISGDGARAATSVQTPEGEFGVATINLIDRNARVSFTIADCRNPHVQLSRNSDYKLSVQVNDGISFEEHGNMLRLIGDLGASLHIVNEDGSGHVKLPVGSSPLERVQGHQTWQGIHNRIITTTHRRATVNDPWNQHRIVTVGPDDSEYTIVGDGERDGIHFCHMHTTPDGRYWIRDCNRTARVHIGSTKPGRHKLLANSDATFGAMQHTHPHPFFIGSGKWVGWNSDRDGTTHIFVARLPDGFLDELG